MPHTAPTPQLEFVGKERRIGGFPVPDDHHIVTLFSGDCYVAEQPKQMLVTILGSCISACIRDPITKIGGMNHFLLPHGGDHKNKPVNEATRYGAFAMEKLINGIVNRGGVKSRLEVKVFGGGNVIKSNTPIGENNITFVQDFLTKEGLKIISSDLGGNYPRRIHYYPDSGKVMMRNLQRKDDFLIADDEKKYAETLRFNPIEGEVSLF